jgi:hypothetical protein
MIHLEKEVQILNLFGQPSIVETYLDNLHEHLQQHSENFVDHFQPCSLVASRKISSHFHLLIMMNFHVNYMLEIIILLLKIVWASRIQM